MQHYLENPKTLIGRAIQLDGTSIAIKNKSNGKLESTWSYETLEEAKEAWGKLHSARLSAHITQRTAEYRRIIKLKDKKGLTSIQYTGWIR